MVVDRSPRLRLGRAARRAALAALALSLLPAAPAAAAVAPPDAPAEFWLDAITVRGNERIPADLIVSESRLETGRAYTEDELRRAVYRVQRLPFVLSADLSLARGSERGRYELVIAVVETRRFFFGGGVSVVEASPPTARSQGTDVEFPAAAGVRLFAGRYGVVYAAVGGDETGVGYARYRLFGRPALLDLLVGKSICAVRRGNTIVGLPPDDLCRDRLFPLGLDPTLSLWDSFGDGERARIGLHLPVAGDHALHVAVSASRSDEGIRTSAYLRGIESFYRYRDLVEVRGGASWVYDTRDDPLLPTRGVEWSAGLEYAAITAELIRRDPSPDFPVEYTTVPLPTARSRQLLAVASVEKHWPLGLRQALSAGARGGVGRSRLDDFPLAERAVGDADLDVWQSRVSLRHAVALRRPRPQRRADELWWETTAAYSYDGTSPDFGARANPLAQLTLTTGLTWRNSWGIFRFGYTYLDVEVAP